MRTNVALALAALSSTALADFTFGTWSGEQAGGTWQDPEQMPVAGHIILGVDGETYSQSDFCSAGTGLAGNDEDGNPLDKAWTEINLDSSDPPNFCDKPIPGLPTNYVIRLTGTGANGDCGEGSVTGDREADGSVGSVVDLIAAPDGELASCYYDVNCQHCANTGSQYAQAIFTCLGSVGGTYNSGIKGVNTNEAVSDC